jgi:isoleucyl-tRNA synthetase
LEYTFVFTDELKSEGIASKLVNRVQNLRKDSGLEVTDKILLTVKCASEIQAAIAQNEEYVCNEVLATEISFGSFDGEALVVDLVQEGDAKIGLVKS